MEYKKKYVDKKVGIQNEKEKTLVFLKNYQRGRTSGEGEGKLREGQWWVSKGKLIIFTSYDQQIDQKTYRVASFLISYIFHLHQKHLKIKY